MSSRILAVIFDLDLTLVDTSSLTDLRAARNWPAVYKGIPWTTLYPGVRELLDECLDLGLKLGIVTTAPSTYCAKVVEFHQIPVECRVCYHDVPRGRIKPHPDQMLLCSERLGVPPSQCLAIGDDPRDIASAEAAAKLGNPWAQLLKDFLVQAGSSATGSIVFEAIKFGAGHILFRM